MTLDRPARGPPPGVLGLVVHGSSNDQASLQTLLTDHGAEIIHRHVKNHEKEHIITELTVKLPDFKPRPSSLALGAEVHGVIAP